ncbi:MAG: mechanosensitive ion channel domain-containing protein [Cyclobacteriaceae bacterium]
MKEQFNSLSEYSSDIMQVYAPRLVSAALSVLAAILVLIIGIWIIRKIVNSVTKRMVKKNIDPSLVPFLSSIINIGLYTLLIITVIGLIGIEMTSFIAVIGAAGLAVGLALQGSLANFAGGVMILIFKPFKVGDYIDGAGHSGTVNSIQIFHTILKTPDNVTIVIPNGNLSNNSIKNFSTEPRRRVDNVFGIAYGDDVEKAYEVLKSIIDADTRILRDPEPFMAVSELADSSVNIVTRSWVNSADFWAVKFAMIKDVYEKFDKAGLSIPYPQMDVHVHKEESA